MEEHCLLVYSLWLAQSSVYTTQEHMVKGALPTVGWGLPHQSRKHPVDMSIVESDGGIFSAEIPSFELILGCVRVAI